MNSFELKPWESRGLLDGSITTLVRPVVLQERDIRDARWDGASGLECCDGQWFIKTSDGALDWSTDICCPFGKPGDRLWCKEPWAMEDPEYIVEMRAPRVMYWSTEDWEGKVKSARSMPQEFSRLTIEVKAVRVERLHSFISSFKTNAIFIRDMPETFPLDGTLPDLIAILNRMREWDTDWPEHPWESNPWVWIGEVKVV